MNNNKTPKSGDGDFLLVVSGTIWSAPYLSGWQEFKDHIRNVVKRKPGWVGVCSSQSQCRSEVQGWARLRDRKDADTAYAIYSGSEGTLVHLWETGRSSESSHILRCNCSSLFPEVSEGGHSPDRCGIDLGRVGDQTGGGGDSNYSTSTPQYMSTQSSHRYACPTTNGYNALAAFPNYTAPGRTPVYAANTYGILVNIQNGAFLAVARGIFIQNLNFRCSPSDLHSLLFTVGQPVDYKLIRDSRTGTFKGHATALFGSQEEAQRAACCLDRIEHMGMTLTVRMDKETTTVGRTGPPLVVGSDMLYTGRQ